jgi:hypothetical protein
MSSGFGRQKAMRSLILASLGSLLAWSIAGAVEDMEIDFKRFEDMDWEEVHFDGFVLGSEEWRLVAQTEMELCTYDGYRALISSMRYRSASKEEERWYRIWKITSHLRTAVAAVDIGVEVAKGPLVRTHSGRSWDFWADLAKLGFYNVGKVESGQDGLGVNWAAANLALAGMFEAFVPLLEESECDKHIPPIDARRLPTRRR